MTETITQSNVSAQICTTEEGSHFSMGLNTHRVPMSMHKNNRQKLVSRFPNLKVSSSLKKEDKI